MDRLLQALANVIKFPKQPKVLEDEEDDYKFRLDDKFLSATGPLSEEDKSLIREEVGRYDEILEFLESAPQKDEDAIMDLWDDYIDRIEERINESQKRA